MRVNIKDGNDFRERAFFAIRFLLIIINDDCANVSSELNKSR